MLIWVHLDVEKTLEYLQHLLQQKRQRAGTAD
jgi:hypothetical protein